jgi:hypothetical protein
MQFLVFYANWRSIMASPHPTLPEQHESSPHLPPYYFNTILTLYYQRSLRFRFSYQTFVYVFHFSNAHCMLLQPHTLRLTLEIQEPVCSVRNDMKIHFCPHMNISLTRKNDGSHGNIIFHKTLLQLLTPTELKSKETKCCQVHRNYAAISDIISILESVAQRVCLSLETWHLQAPFLVVKSRQWVIQTTVAYHNPIPWRRMILERKKSYSSSAYQNISTDLLQHLQTSIPTPFIHMDTQSDSFSSSFSY